MVRKFLCPAVLLFGGCGVEMGKDGWNCRGMAFLAREIPNLFGPSPSSQILCVCPLIRIRALPLPLAPVAAPHPLRICWEKQPKSPGIEKTHGKDLLEESCSLWVVRGEIFPVLCTEMCWKPRAGGPGLDAALCPRSTKPLLPPALRICSFPFPWPRG